MASRSETISPRKKADSIMRRGSTFNRLDRSGSLMGGLKPIHGSSKNLLHKSSTSLQASYQYKKAKAGRTKSIFDPAAKVKKRKIKGGVYELQQKTLFKLKKQFGDPDYMEI